MRRLFLLSFLLGQTFFAQSWNGYIQTEYGDPLPYVFLINTTTGEWQSTDESGYFQLTGQYTTGDTIRCKRYGYQTRKFVLPEAEEILITLAIDPVVMPGVFSSAKKMEGLVRPGLIEISVEPTHGIVEHRSIFESVPGLSLRTYGGPGSIGTVSLDGGAGTQTKVLIGEFDLTNAQNGITDISQLPTPLIRNVRYFPETSTSYGSGSADGTLSLNPFNRNSGFSFATGSYGHRSANAVVNLKNHNHSTRVLIGTRYDKGDYSVRWRDRQYTRQNNFFNQNYGAVQFSYLWPTERFFKILFLHSGQDRGLAGQVWSPAKAFRQDNLSFLGMTLGWVKSWGVGHFLNQIRYSEEYYQFPLYGIQSEHRLLSAKSVLRQTFNLQKDIRIISQSEIQIDSLNSTGGGQHQRMILSQDISAQLKVFSGWELHPQVRYDYANQLFDERTYSLLTIYRFRRGIFKAVSFHYGKYFRYPTFNELYWSPGGNPELQPEHNQNLSLQINLQHQLSGDLKLLLFKKDAVDLIQWVPLLTYWHPVNIKKVGRLGWKLVWQWKSPSLPVSGFLSYSDTKTENLNPGDHFGKPLTYAPRNTATISVNWNPGQWTFHTQGHHRSRIISQYSWPADVVLPAATLITLSSGYTLNLYSGRLIGVVAIDNVADTAYESARGYPEAGRSYRFTLTFEFD